MQIRGVRSAGPGDDQARFLADLRALRDSAAIGHDELAARAHYPTDVLQEAENGPRLPGLPILTAYVRACEGDVLDWEERWRQLSAEVPEDRNLPVRPAGASEAAAAGARAGVSIAPPDAYDPDRIRAALRGGRIPSGRAAHRTAAPGPLAPAPGMAGTELPVPGADTPAGPAAIAGTPWDAAGWDSGIGLTPTVANGDHSTNSGSGVPFGATSFGTAPSGTPSCGTPSCGTPSSGTAPSGTAYSAYTAAPDGPGGLPEAAGGVTPAAGDNLTRLPESAPEPAGSGAPASPADSGFDWLRPSGAPSEAHPAESNVMWSDAEATSALTQPAVTQPAVTQPAVAEPAVAEPAVAEPAVAEPAVAEPAATEPAGSGPTGGESRPWQQDSIMKPPQREDFWVTPSAAQADLQPPTDTQPAWATTGEDALAPPPAPASPATAPASPATAPASSDAAPASPATAPASSDAAPASSDAAPASPAAAEPAAAQPQGQSQSPAHSSAHGPAHGQAAVPQPRKPDRLFSVKLIAIIIIAAIIGSVLVLLLK